MISAFLRLGIFCTLAYWQTWGLANYLLWTSFSADLFGLALGGRLSYVDAVVADRGGGVEQQNNNQIYCYHRIRQLNFFCSIFGSICFLYASNVNVRKILRYFAILSQG